MTNVKESNDQPTFQHECYVFIDDSLTQAATHEEMTKEGSSHKSEEEDKWCDAVTCYSNDDKKP